MSMPAPPPVPPARRTPSPYAPAEGHQETVRTPPPANAPAPGLPSIAMPPPSSPPIIVDYDDHLAEQETPPLDDESFFEETLDSEFLHDDVVEDYAEEALTYEDTTVMEPALVAEEYSDPIITVQETAVAYDSDSDSETVLQTELDPIMTTEYVSAPTANPLPTEPVAVPVPVLSRPTLAGEPSYEEGQKRGVLFTPEVQAAAQALLDFIGDNECSEVLLNGPNECSRKIKGSRYHCPEVAFGDADSYHDVINEVILNYCDTPDRIDNHNVLIEGQLELPSPTGEAPMLARVHVIAPPGVKYAKVTIAKKPRTDLTLDSMVHSGALTREMAEFLRAVARGKSTFVVSGPTGAGKTTMLQAMSHFFDPNDRIVVIEETPELRLPLGDVVYLRATLERPGMNPSEIYSLAFWTRQANRMRMDRVIVGETRGGEMAEWLIAANSGAEGSATTVHADSPRRTLDKMLGLASRANGAMSEEQLRREIAATVDIIVQCSLIDGRHIISGIEEIANTVTHQTGQILSNPIFSYDRGRGAHVVKGRPSDEFIARLGNRGVPLNASWFRGTPQK